MLNILMDFQIFDSKIKIYLTSKFVEVRMNTILTY
jgi:hypothetical protein